MRRIGVLTNLSSDDPAQQSRVLAFAQTLAQSGWTEGRNVRIDIRWGATDPERVRRYVAETVALAPDVILAVGSAATGGAAAGDERCADRVRAGRRPGGRWLRRNPRSAGRQRHWFYAV